MHHSHHLRGAKGEAIQHVSMGESQRLAQTHRIVIADRHIHQDGSLAGLLYAAHYEGGSHPMPAQVRNHRKERHIHEPLGHQPIDRPRKPPDHLRRLRRATLARPRYAHTMTQPSRIADRYPRRGGSAQRHLHVTSRKRRVDIPHQAEHRLVIRSHDIDKPWRRHPEESPHCRIVLLSCPRYHNCLSHK